MKILWRLVRSSSTTTVLAVALCGIVQEMVYRGIERAVAANALAVGATREDLAEETAR